MKFFKDIFRQPALFIPIVITAVLSVMLVLISFSLSDSCNTMLETFDDEYATTLTMNKKNILKRVEKKGSGNKSLFEDDYVLKDVNDVIISERIISEIEVLNEVTDVSYVTESFESHLQYICSSEKYKEIADAVANKQDFVGVYDSFSPRNRIEHYVQFVGCSDEEYLYAAIESNSINITYREGCKFEDGVLLPKALYDLYDAPNEIVNAWFASILRHGNSGGKENEWFDEEGNFSPPEYYASNVEYSKKHSEPIIIVPVAGYYTATDIKSKSVPIVCPIDYLKKLYGGYVYSIKNDKENWQSYNVLDDLGIREAYIDIVSAKDAGKVIEKIIKKSVDPDKVLITANDYDYKFAISQLGGVTQFSRVLSVVSVVFALLTVTLAIHYSVGKRRREIYTLSTLGKSRAGIVFAMSAESNLILLISAALGVALSEIIGTSLCAYIRHMTAENAKNAAGSLSKVASMMSGHGKLQAQLASASEVYLGAAPNIVYDVPEYVLYGIALGVAVFAVYTLVQYVRISKIDLMKKGS